MNIEIVQHIAAQIVIALQYLREKNICHRDLKPENIMLDENFDIKIVNTLIFKLYFINNFYLYLIILQFQID